jgi:hypothetical protein
MLTLRQAIAKKRLAEFAREQEEAGTGPIDSEEFDAAVKRLVKAPQSKRRTSRSQGA